MELFVDPIKFEKTANLELEENPATWPRQIITELYRTIPEITDYVPEVSMMRVDEERGYGLGVVVVTNVTGSALATQEVESAASRKALVPVIIKDYHLFPLDLLMTSGGKMYPLTPARLREALFRPEGFELITDDWGDTALWGLMAPPGRSETALFGGNAGGGMGGGASYMSGPGMKMAGAAPEMLQALSGTFLEPDITALESRFLADPALCKLAQDNPAVVKALYVLSQAEMLTEKTAAAREAVLEQLYPVDVVQLGYDSRGYWTKTASRQTSIIDTKFMERGEFLKFAGPELTKRVDTEGTITLSEPVVVQGPQGDKLEVATSSGSYYVYDAGTGKSYEGHVYTQLVDGTGAVVPISVFVNADLHSVQDQIGVTRACQQGVTLATSPKGTGLFVSDVGSCARATIPLHVNTATLQDGERRFECSDMTGESVTVILSTGCQGVVALPKARTIMMPASTIFVALRGPDAPLLQGSSDESVKDIVENKLASLDLVSHGSGLFEARVKGAPKLAQLAALSDDQDSVLFLLGMGGIGARDAVSAIKTAELHGTLRLTVQEPKALAVDVEKLAQDYVAQVHGLRQDLIKEAAVLPDTATVDSILSLGFINSENVRTFVAKIPYLEKALSTICELAMASRLGLNEIPESATIRAARGLDGSLTGLKALALRDTSDVA